MTMCHGYFRHVHGWANKISFSTSEINTAPASSSLTLLIHQRYDLFSHDCRYCVHIGKTKCFLVSLVHTLYTPEQGRTGRRNQPGRILPSSPNWPIAAKPHSQLGKGSGGVLWTCPAGFGAEAAEPRPPKHFGAL